MAVNCEVNRYSAQLAGAGAGAGAQSSTRLRYSARLVRKKKQRRTWARLGLLTRHRDFVIVSGL